MLALSIFLLPAVLTWAWGYDGFVVVNLLSRAGHVVVSRWGHQVGRVWQMHYALWVWVWD